MASTGFTRGYFQRAPPGQGNPADGSIQAAGAGGSGFRRRLGGCGGISRRLCRAHEISGFLGQFPVVEIPGSL